MRKILVVGALLVISSLAASAQAKPTYRVYETVESSQQWVEQTQKLSIKEQLAAIQQRVQCDAQVRDESREPKLCFMGVSAEKRKKYDEQRRLALEQDKRPRGYTLLYFIDGQPADAQNSEGYERLQRLESVKTITFFADQTATAIYGSRAASGVVAISTKK